MTDTDDRPTTQERYQRAAQSSNLKHTRVGTTGDVDVIGADGMVHDTLGASLFRLVGEYDACRGEKVLYEAEAARLYEAQREAAHSLQGLRRASKPDQAAIAAAKAAHDHLGEQARREVTTGRAMVLIHLKTLASTKQQLGAFALGLAKTYPFAFADRDLMALTGRVLDVFLDPTCPHCQGRGFNGGGHRGEKQVICRACRGCGHRRDDVGRNADERHLAGRLLAEMSRKMTEAEKSIRLQLRDTVHDAYTVTAATGGPPLKGEP